MGEITVSVVGSKNPNWFDTHQIPKNAAYAIRLMVTSPGDHGRRQATDMWPRMRVNLSILRGI